eukprot:5682097-Lingulodinium_polyedra.AAC.1
MPKGGSRKAEALWNGGRGAAVQAGRKRTSWRHAAPAQPAKAEAEREHGRCASCHPGQARSGPS